ncbi:MAG: hypothetical protein V1770_03635 [bacterium]
MAVSTKRLNNILEGIRKGERMKEIYKSSDVKEEGYSDEKSYPQKAIAACKKKNKLIQFNKKGL